MSFKVSRAEDAVREVAETWEEKESLKFFYRNNSHPDGELAHALLDFISLPDFPPQPTLTILIGENHYILPQDTLITAGSVLGFIQGVLSGAVAEHEKAAARPVNDQHNVFPLLLDLVSSSFREVVDRTEYILVSFGITEGKYWNELLETLGTAAILLVNSPIKIATYDLGKNTQPEGLPLNTDNPPPFILLFHNGIPVLPYPSSPVELDVDQEGAAPGLEDILAFLDSALPQSHSLALSDLLPRARELTNLVTVLRKAETEIHRVTQLLTHLADQFSDQKVLTNIQVKLQELQSSLETIWGEEGGCCSDRKSCCSEKKSSFLSGKSPGEQTAELERLLNELRVVAGPAAQVRPFLWPSDHLTI